MTLSIRDPRQHRLTGCATGLTAVTE